MSKILITSALPYINGVKHLGNLVGSLLPADVHARFRRQLGDEVLFICGTDEHGTPAELGAIEAGDSHCRRPALRASTAGKDAGFQKLAGGSGLSRLAGERRHDRSDLVTCPKTACQKPTSKPTTSRSWALFHRVCQAS
jgi:leucyl-tRNA synthetase